MMTGRLLRRLCALVLAVCSIAAVGAVPPQPLARGEDVLSSSGQPGQYGGRLVVALRAEPKTLNPVTAGDGPSRDVIWRMAADLLHINRVSQLTGPALAKSWKVSPDGLRYTLKLRDGIRFSDGHPFDADDVVFSFQVYLDEKVNSPQRDLLVVGGKAIVVRKLDAHTVSFELAQPYAAAERLFDSVAILPRHILQKPYQEGRFAQMWTLVTPAAEIAGLGPFRLKEYVAGQQLVLERNPYYWKADRSRQRLPYLDEVVFLFVPSEDAQVIRFQAGDTDVMSRMSAENFAVLERDQQARGYQVNDLGPGLEYNFLVFNLNSVLPNESPIAQRQGWFKDVRFRQAVSNAIDRASIIRLVYRGRGTPLISQVSAANKLWANTAIAPPQRSLEKARELLKSAGFSWDASGSLLDSSGKPVEFTILSSASNAQRTQIATIIQDDLKALGMRVQVVPMEFRAMLDRVLQTHDYDAAVMALGGGDVDPNPQINVWVSSGSNHLWDLGASKPATAWEVEIDRLMRQQLSTLKVKERKRLYDRVQQLVAENLPLLCVVSPNILVAAKNRVGNFQPAILDHYTLWNADELFLRSDISH
jgi:peptide/nickel transport system substrate-binding protein